MTLNDLKEEISALGFEREIELDKSLVFAIRRAMNTVYTERGVYNRLSLEHYPILPTLVCKKLIHKPKNVESFDINGRAYSFTACGNGSFSIEENGKVQTHLFNSPKHLFRGFISEKARLSFEGDFTFEILNISVFESVKNEREEDIFPYGEPFEYKINEYSKDFHSFASLPKDEWGRTISGASLSGNKMFIPWDYRGTVNLSYKVAPPEISMDACDDEIPIPREIEHLIPLLTAAYYWVDDSPEKAEYYLALYRDALRIVKLYSTRALGGGYEDVTGWA